ncbi:MAG: RNA 2',3'-cyclic phosphodiesterase [Clostridiales bacterium]|nr:RNA 2',3'-cyclic phosphodiesterase [Clostridiales bacterium]
MRAFIACDLDKPLKEKLGGLICQLRRRGGDIRWVRTEGMHLTLKFLGEIREETAEKVKSALGVLARRHKPFVLNFQGTGTFPPGRKARVLWVGIKDISDLRELQEDLEKEMERLGFLREKRGFQPHLTLGRVKSSHGLGPVIEEFQKEAATVFGETEVLRLTLFQSILKPTGAEYSILGEYPLG